MAIKGIPQITGPSFGGVIYGLTLSAGFSSEPSKLTLDIVNENGIYATPSLNSSASVSFAGFNFNGIIWSYSIKESASEKTLQVTLVDRSIELDRQYVLLWKRGLLNLAGSLQSKEKTFNFNDESVLVPRKNTKFSGFPFTEFVEKRLGSEKIIRKSRKLGKAVKGSVIVVGEEKFANSECDIPDTWYSFGDLGIDTGGLNFDPDYKATHEGTLREVLKNWCADFGYDFYWDYSNNRIVFFDVKNGISGVPNVTHPSIISKEYSQTMEGTFRQYGIAYSAMPKEPIKTLSQSKSFTILYTVSPINISYFVKKIGEKQKLDVTREKWGGKRSESDFVQAAFLGLVSRALRDLYSFQNEHWEALGYKLDSGIKIPKAKLINFLKKKGFEMIGDLESFDSVGLPNYNMDLINYDPTIADKWNEVEQKLLTYYGRYYRIPDSSGSFFYCAPKYTAEVTISVEPEGTTQEPNSEQFTGKKIYVRDGEMSHDSISAQEALGYEKLIQEIDNCAPIYLPLKEGGLADGLINAGLLKGEDANKVNNIVIYPNSEKFVKQKIGFSSDISRGLNPLEQTIYDQKDANVKNGKKICKDYEDAIAKGSCQSAEEEAKNKAMKKVGSRNDDENPQNFIGGLLTKSARSCTIKLKEGRVKIYAPSDSNLQVVCNYSITLNKIADLQNPEFIFSDGNPGSASDVAEIRIANENATDAQNDSYQQKRQTEFVRPKDVICNNPQGSAKYVFAGSPVGVSLSPGAGLTNMDVTLSSEGFTTSVTFSTRPPQLAKADNTMRIVHSQFNRTSFNSN